MSLGWQSESALLPSKATPINVDSKSMMSMKALVYTIEQKLSSKTAGLDKMIHKRKIPRQVNSDVERTTTKERFSGDNKYPSLKKHRRADMQEDDEANIKVAASLRAKAALYDQIAERRGAEEQFQNCPLQNSIASSGNGAFLINFDEKRKAESLCDPSERSVSKASRYETDDKRKCLQDSSSLNGGNRSSSSNSSSSSSSSGSSSNRDNCAERYINDKNEEVIDIIDSFGRCKTILIQSKEYELHLENFEIEKTKKKFHEKNCGDTNIFNKNLESSSRSDNNPNNYAWSNGQNHNESGEWLRDLVTEKGIRALVDQKVEKEIELSNGAKVKTMYEKTLSSSAKSFLKEVHEDSIMQRTLHLEKSNGVTSSRLDDRRELLRLKKLQLLNK